MDPITHAVVGAAIAVLIGEPASLSNPAFISCISGAVIPDSDIIMQIKGHYKYLKSHRGISHSIPMLFLYSGLITAALWLIFGGILSTKVFAYALIGCFSHILLDITNSYGAKIFWPLYNKKITTDLLLIYDPMLIIMSIIILVPGLRVFINPAFVILMFVSYLLLRYTMKLKAIQLIYHNLSGRYDIGAMRVLPSMVGFIRWHYIVMNEKEKIIGDVNIFPRHFRIIKRVENLEQDLYDIVSKTPLAEFFSEFTPVFHIACEKSEKGYTFNFTDLRYYMAKDFLHHATAVLNTDFKTIKSLFHPYSRSKNVEV